MSPLLPPSFFRAAHGADARAKRLLRSLRTRVGLHRSLIILPYRGYGTAERAVVKARVLEDNRAPAPVVRRPLLGAAVASYRRFATAEIPHARVQVRWGNATYEGRTDEEGFLDLWVAPPAHTRPGWHRVEVSLLEPGERASVTAQVLVVGEGAERGIISDLDDTVIATGVPNLFRRAWALFMSEAAGRRPFEGVRDYYAALQSGPTGGAHNPIFYVSSSPWNLYDHLAHFLDHHNLPAGPIVLRDWGLTRDGFAPGGGHGHKKAKVLQILDTFPHLPFVLLGDSGQQDAKHYASIAAERPHQVAGIVIRDVTATPRREATLRALAEQVRRGGHELVLVPDTEAAFRHAAEREWVAPVRTPR
jgi:phosphatidate phosphatase APP1